MITAGDKVKHYEILEPLGKGGMGEVFLAQDTVLNRKVAIKFLPEEMQKEPAARMRLLREAKAAASLDHPFICKIFETGEIQGTVFIVMEFVEGKNLRDKLDEGTLPLRDSLQMALEIAEALKEAHEKGIVHRDLKPANVMLMPSGHVKVMDFGLAKHFLPEGEDEITKTLTQTSITEQGAIVGTLAYMSPEQARGENVDIRSDIFSLGIIIYEMTTGKHPFSKSSPLETLTSILRDATPPVQAKPRMVNPLLGPILRKALAKESVNRYQDISDLIIDIRKLQREITGGLGFLFRRWQVLAGGILIIAMLLLGVWWLGRRTPVSTIKIEREPFSILIADFQNQTGEEIFDGALEQALSIGLEDASFIDIYKRPAARKQAGRLDAEAAGKLDSRLAQLVSTSIGIDYVVNGLINKDQKGYSVGIWALDPVTSEKVAEASEKIKTKSEWNKAADSLVSHLLSKLGGIPEGSSELRSKEIFTTSSLEAMHAYARAQELFSRGEREKAVKEYLRAIEEDPDFGRAYASLAATYHNLGELQKAEECHSEALSRIDKMGEREKYTTRSVWYLLTKNYQKAIEELNEFVNKFPADSAGNNNLALVYYYVRDMQRAVEKAQKVAELYPKNITSHFNLVWYALGANNFELAEQEATKVLEINPEFAKVYVPMALIELAQERPELAADKYRELESMSSWGAFNAATGLADLALYEGRLKDAKEILEKTIAAEAQKGQINFLDEKWVMLAQTLLLQKQNIAAFDAIDKAVALSNKTDVLFPAALIYIQAGREERASEIAMDLGGRLTQEPQAYAKLIEGEIKIKRGQMVEAINLFQESRNLVDMWLTHLSLGKAYLEADAFTEAYSEFEECLKRRGEASAIFLNDIPSYRYFPQVYYYLGRAQEGLGSTAASESYQKFLKIKQNGDGDWMVEDARKRLESQ